MNQTVQLIVDKLSLDNFGNSYRKASSGCSLIADRLKIHPGTVKQWYEGINKPKKSYDLVLRDLFKETFGEELFI